MTMLNGERETAYTEPLGKACAELVEVLKMGSVEVTVYATVGAW